MKKLISLIICALLIVTSLGACTKTEDEGYFVRTKRCEYGRLSVSLSKYSKDNNTRFIPESAEEYDALLTALRTKADNNELLVRNINKGEDHSWKVASADNFYPSFLS